MKLTTLQDTDHPEQALLHQCLKELRSMVPLGTILSGYVRSEGHQDTCACISLRMHGRSYVVKSIRPLSEHAITASALRMKQTILKEKRKFIRRRNHQGSPVKQFLKEVA